MVGGEGFVVKGSGVERPLEIVGAHRGKFPRTDFGQGSGI